MQSAVQAGRKDRLRKRTGEMKARIRLRVGRHDVVDVSAQQVADRTLDHRLEGAGAGIHSVCSPVS